VNGGEALASQATRQIREAPKSPRYSKNSQLLINAETGHQVLGKDLHGNPTRFKKLKQL